MFGLAASLILIFLFVFAPEAAFIIFGGLLISLILLGLTEKAKQRINTSKRLILGAFTLGGVALIVGASWLVSARLAAEMSIFAKQLPEAVEEVYRALMSNQWFAQLVEEAKQANWLETFIAPKVLPSTAKLATLTINGITAFGISLFVGIYFALDSKRYGKVIAMLTPRERESFYRDFFRALKANLQNWLLGELFSMMTVGALTYLGLLLLGIKAAFPLAFIAGLLGFIPNIGPILSVVPAVVIAFADGWLMALYVILLYVVVQTLEGALITPLIQKAKVRVLPGGLISFQFIMASLFGFGGLFMATPLLVALMTVVDKFWVQNSRR